MTDGKWSYVHEIACGNCASRALYRAGRRPDLNYAKRRARDDGWLETARYGWLCPQCRVWMFSQSKQGEETHA